MSAPSPVTDRPALVWDADGTDACIRKYAIYPCNLSNEDTAEPVLLLLAMATQATDGVYDLTSVPVGIDSHDILLTAMENNALTGEMVATLSVDGILKTSYPPLIAFLDSVKESK